MARANLAAIRVLVPHLPGQAHQGRPAYRTHEGVPGGDATVLLTPAALARPPDAVVPVYVELPGDPRPPLDVLAYWTNVWRAYTSNPSNLPPNLGRVCAYLDAVLGQVATDTSFPGLARDLTRVLHQVENVLHAGDRPDVSRVPCWDCGTRLVKVWGSELARDAWSCPTCGEHYDQGRYDRAQHDHLASTGAERFVLVADATEAVGRPVQTVRAWIRRGLVETMRDPRSGRLLAWWPDVRMLHRTTPTRASTKANTRGGQ